LARRCIAAGAVDVRLREVFGGGRVFERDPMTNAAWRARARENIPPPPIAAPTLIVQGTDDEVVLPGTTTTYVEGACAAGARVTADFIGDIDHSYAGVAGAPLAFTYFQERFAGVADVPTCGTIPPVPALGR
jgi:hypothetical protein